MRPTWIWMGLVGFAALGCGNPMKVVTANRICDVVHTNNKVVLEMGVNPDGGQVIAVPLVKAGADCPRVAVLDVDGLILNQDFTGPLSMGENPVALFREKLDAISADPNVRAVVLRINTPGGSVTATDILWHDLQEFKSRTKLPVVACLMDVSAGGGYYLASAADTIVAHPTTVTGGIGVILNLYNLRELMGQFNIQPQEIKSGKHIDMGTPVRNLPEDARKLLESMAKEYHDRFLDVVRKARPRLDPKNETIFDGRVFTARSALEIGLVDRLGYLDDAVALAREQANCSGASPVLYRRANDPARSLYAVTPNTPLHATMLPLSVPGMDRSKLPTFLYLWQPEATLPRLSGR
ncbi:MAG: signal peptide peptidase SppA [Gemmataceae bacterium]